MPAKNLYHDAVVAALIADGWTITDDPLVLKAGERRLYVDLAAERSVFAAERSGERIAVEVQSFVGLSDVADLQQALGQYVLYRSVLGRTEPDRLLYLAISQKTFDGLFSEPIGQYPIDDLDLRMIVFDIAAQRVTEWID